MRPRDPLVEDIRRSLRDPMALARMLNMKPRRSPRGAVVLCPVHNEKSPSCSITPGSDGTLRVRCFGCDWRGDVLHFIAAALNLNPKSDFREVLASAADLAGMADQAQALRDGKPPPERAERPSAPPPEPERDYPPEAEVAELWATARPVTEDAAAVAMLEGRRLNPRSVESLNAARVLLPETHRSRIPSWAWFRGRRSSSAPWTKTGHRLIVPVYDCMGRFRSVRAWLVEPQDNTPKRVPPVGHKASQLVLASREAVSLLRGEDGGTRIVVCEGEPDTLARMIVSPGEVVIGVLSGSWHDGFAHRIPYGSEVVIRTHLDQAGEKYSDAVFESVRDRAQVYRLNADREDAA